MNSMRDLLSIMESALAESYPFQDQDLLDPEHQPDHSNHSGTLSGFTQFFVSNINQFMDYKKVSVADIDELVHELNTQPGFDYLVQGWNNYALGKGKSYDSMDPKLFKAFIEKIIKGQPDIRHDLSNTLTIKGNDVIAHHVRDDSGKRYDPTEDQRSTKYDEVKGGRPGLNKPDVEEGSEDGPHPSLQGMFDELGVSENTHVDDNGKEIPLSQVGSGYWLCGFDRDGSCFEMSKMSREEAKDSITGHGEYKVADADITDFAGARYYWNENMPDTGVLHITSVKESSEGGPTPSQMSDAELADYIGASEEEVRADREAAEEAADDKSRDHMYEGDFEPIEDILEREDSMVVGADDGQLYTFMRGDDGDKEKVKIGSTPEQVADGLKKCGYRDGTQLYGSSSMDFCDEEGFDSQGDAEDLLDAALEILHGKNEDINKANDFEDDIKQKDVCPQCGSADCTCPPGECDCTPVNESYPYGVVAQQDQDSESINYTKTKKVGDSTLTISANAKSLAELQELLQMAGLNPEKAEDYVDPYDKDSDDVCDCCGKEIVDGSCGCDDHDHPEEPKMLSYSTDKKAIVDMLKAKLAQKLH